MTEVNDTPEMTTSTRTQWDEWQPEIRATLMFIVRDGQVLLIDKLTGIGQGKVNGPGGKIDPNETAEEAIIRECQEELHITPLDPVKMGELCFAMSDIPDIHCHVFIAEEFTGEPKPTVEANPFWEKIIDIPYDKMWEDDQYWLPQMLEGQQFFAQFDFTGEAIDWMDVRLGEESVNDWLGE